MGGAVLAVQRRCSGRIWPEQAPSERQGQHPPLIGLPVSSGSWTTVAQPPRARATSALEQQIAGGTWGRVAPTRLSSTATSSLLTCPTPKTAPPASRSMPHPDSAVFQRGGLPQHKPDHPDRRSYFPRSEEPTDAAQLAGDALGASGSNRSRPAWLPTKPRRSSPSQPPCIMPTCVKYGYFGAHPARWLRRLDRPAAPSSTGLKKAHLVGETIGSAPTMLLRSSNVLLSSPHTWLR